jgi:hypothetical protein
MMNHSKFAEGLLADFLRQMHCLEAMQTGEDAQVKYIQGRQAQYAARVTLTQANISLA